MTLEALAQAVEQAVPLVVTHFVPDRLDYLAAGGRVSNPAALGAALLKIKPRIDILDGKLIAGKKYRGTMAKVVPKLLEDFLAKDLDKRQGYVFYAAGCDLAVVEGAARRMKEAGFFQVDVFQIGCVMSIHGGPGAIGITARRKIAED